MWDNFDKTDMLAKELKAGPAYASWVQEIACKVPSR